ncbi:MAG: hypothetical protein HY226_01780 [Candidatus Vogelbacteria bacterium]|nr:hypothetical protein [Candidatus Vogelbacteria bacterium]
MSSRKNSKSSKANLEKNSDELPVSVGIEDPLKEAISLSKRASAEEIENSAAEREKVADSIVELDQMKSSLLPIEQGLLPMIQAKKTEAAKKIKQLEALNKYSQYALFSYDPFTWRDDKGFPRLAVFSLKSPNFEISVTRSYDSYSGRTVWRKKIVPTLPADLQSCYKDVFSKLNEVARKNEKSAKVRATFASLIPGSVREVIISASKEFKDIFIIAQIDRWDLGKDVNPKPNQNSLVVGYDGVNHWLVTAFDPTSVDSCAKMFVDVAPKYDATLSKKGKSAKSTTVGSAKESGKAKPGRLY